MGMDKNMSTPIIMSAMMTSIFPKPLVLLFFNL